MTSAISGKQLSGKQLSGKQQDPRPARRGWGTVPIGAAAAAVCALVLWTTLVPFGGLDLSADLGGTVKQIGALDVALVAFGVGLVGLLALRLLERFTPKAPVIWTATAAVVLVLSCVGAMGATSTAAMWGLVSLHAVVGAVIIAVGLRSRR